MKTKVLTNQKGGVGKSFYATQFAYYCVKILNKRTLLIDLDHQANTSKATKGSGLAEIASVSAWDILDRACGAIPSAPFVLIESEKVELTKVERQQTRRNEFANNLKHFLDANADNFDVCIIDTNPNPDIRMTAALVLADFVLAPIMLNQEAIDGIGTLLNDIRTIQARVNPRLKFLGILPNMVEPTLFHKNNFIDIGTHHSNLMVSMSDKPGDFAFIRNRTAIAEAQAAGVPLWLLRQAVPPDLEGQVEPSSMPIRTVARDTWKEVRPVFDVIANKMGIV